jgi:ATP-dependent helicase HrpA
MQEILGEIERNLDLCLRKDRYHLGKRLSRLQAEIRRDQAAADRLQALKDSISQSIAQRQLRMESVPELDYPAELPVVERKAEIIESIRNHQVVVVCGETGSGKTTQLPKICLEAGRGVSGYIGHTQPRRIAARTVAARIAEELKQPLGQAVGYKIRFQDHTRSESLIKLMTDGILLAETQHDRFLDQSVKFCPKYPRPLHLSSARYTVYRIDFNVLRFQC